MWIRVSNLSTTLLSGYYGSKSQKILLPYKHLSNTFSGKQALNTSYHLFHRLHKVPAS